jgi:shikimate kinase
MAVGKTSFAKHLSKHLQTTHLDTDNLIEFQQEQTISNIFEQNGEKYFRNCEQKCANWIELNIKNSVISTGGGFYKVDNISKLGKVIWLDATFDEIYERLKQSPHFEYHINKRPLFKDLDKARLLFDSRIEEYEKISDIKINVIDNSVDEFINIVSSKV